MKRLIIISLKSGTGSTTVTANLAQMLHQLGKNTLVVDCVASNVLKLHLGLPFKVDDGWVKRLLQASPWQEANFESPLGVDFIPFGQINNQEALAFRANKPDLFAHLFQELNRATSTSSQNDWQLIHLSIDDLTDPSVARFCDAADLILCVVSPEPSSYYVMQNTIKHHRFIQHHLERSKKLKFLINQFQAETQVGRDFLLVFKKELDTQLIPVVLHKDTALVESIANLTTVQHHAPHSQAAKDYQLLAFWCISHLAALGTDSGKES